jgi:hypothetical protein
MEEIIPNATRNLTINTRQIINTDNTTTWTFNEMSFTQNGIPLLQSYYYQKLQTDNISGIIMINEDEVIDITFENPDEFGTTVSQHPIHIHGHSYWILGTGSLYDLTRNLNFINPIKRDTFTLPYNGWVTIRLVADNPGAWILECHNSWHMIMGMSILFLYPHDTIPNPPNNLPLCFNIKLGDDENVSLFGAIGALSILCFIFITFSIILFMKNRKLGDQYPLLTDNFEIYNTSNNKK